MLKEILN